MSTNQGSVQESIRVITGTTHDYNGDWLALFTYELIPDGDFNGRFILWLQAATGSSETNINDLKQLYATQNGFYNWSSVNNIAALETTYFVTDAGDRITTDTGDYIIR